MSRTTGIGVLVAGACMTLAVVGASAPGRADAPAPEWSLALPYVAVRRPPSPSPSPAAPATASPSGAAIVELRCRGRHEYVRIRNGAPVAVALTGWRLRSVVGAQELALPVIHLEPGAELSVHSGPGADARPPGGILWTRGYVWNNGGDEALLRDAAGSNRAARACDDVASPVGSAALNASSGSPARRPAEPRRP